MTDERVDADERTDAEILAEANGEMIQIPEGDLPTRERFLDEPQIKKPEKSFGAWIILLVVAALTVGFFLYMWAQTPWGLKIDSIKDGYIDSIKMEFTIRDLHGYQPNDLILGIEFNNIVQGTLFPGEEIQPGKYLIPISPGSLQIGKNQIQLSLWVDGKDKPIEVSNVVKFIAR